MNHLIYSIFKKLSFLVTCLILSDVLSSVNSYVIGNKLSKTAGNGQSNIAYSQDNKGSYSFAYEVTDGKSGATNFRQETGTPKAVKGSYGLTDTDGRTRLVNYSADKHGFVATVDSNEPGIGREDAANAAYSKYKMIILKQLTLINLIDFSKKKDGPDKGKGWAYAVAITDKNDHQYKNDQYKANKNKYEPSTYQSYSYSSNFDENKYSNQNKEKEEEFNYDRREEYKNPVLISKPILNQKATNTESHLNKKEDTLIKNVNYESGGTFDTNAQTNGEQDKYQDNDQKENDPKENDQKYNDQKESEQLKTTATDDNSDNLDDNQSEEEQHYDKRQLHLISNPKTSRSDYLTTIDKLAKKEKIKSSFSSTKASQLNSSSKKAINKSDKVISKLISLSSNFDDGTWSNAKYVKK